MMLYGENCHRCDGRLDADTEVIQAIKQATIEGETVADGAHVFHVTCYPTDGTYGPPIYRGPLRGIRPGVV